MNVWSDCYFQAGPLEQLFDPRDPIGPSIVGLSDHNRGREAGVFDMTRFDDEANNSAQSADYPVSTELMNKLRDSIDAILQGQHSSLGTDQRSHRVRCLRNLPRFNAYNHQINFADLVNIIGGLCGEDDKIRYATFDDQPFGFDRAKVRAARDERNVFACVRQTSAKVTADSACSKNSDPHRLLCVSAT